MFPVLRPILNKGGAGRYISREESVERLQPIVANHLDLLQAYTATAARLSDPATRQRFDDVILPNVRTELNKLYETVFSLGGSAPTGAGTDWDESAIDGDEADRLRALIEMDKEFGETVSEEADAVHHQERTRAILMHNAAKSGERLTFLRGLVNN